MANRNRKFNPEDIVGEVFGPYKVIKYVGLGEVKHRVAKKDTAMEHRYLVECMKCRSQRISSRNTIKHEYCTSKNCTVCSGRLKIESINKDKLYTIYHDKAMDTWRANPRPSKDNISTGIKRYNISFLPNRCKGNGEYVHRVEVAVDRKKYVLIRRYDKSGSILPECVKIANELNEVLSHGKENFHRWYEENYKENYK